MGHQLGQVIALPAAGIQHLGMLGHPFTKNSLHRLGNGGIISPIQKRAAGCHHVPGVTGVLGVLLGHRQQVHITLPCNIKAVAITAYQRFLLLVKSLPTDRAAKDCSFHQQFLISRIKNLIAFSVFSTRIRSLLPCTVDFSSPVTYLPENR